MPLPNSFIVFAFVASISGSTISVASDPVGLPSLVSAPGAFDCAAAGVAGDSGGACLSMSFLS